MEEKIKNKQELEREGWTLASITGGDHLKRTLEMYQELGIETYLEQVKSEDCNDCTACYSAGNEIVYRIYTRSTDDEIDKGVSIY